MTMPIKWLPFIILLIALSGAEAQTINAASCSATDVQTALNAVSADGTTVNIPACPGGVTWSSSVTYNQVYSTVIQGQTTCIGTPTSSCTDNTLLIINNPIQFTINTVSGKSLRLTGVTVQNIGSNSGGAVLVTGSSNQFRMDHVHLHAVSNSGGSTQSEINGPYGVIDHCLLSNDAWVQTFLFHHATLNGIGRWGDESWALPTSLGSSNFLFIEDNTFIGGIADDSREGGRWVFRHNSLLGGAAIQTHPTGSGGRERGSRAWEIYSNTMSVTPNPNPAFNFFFVSAGTGVIWGNTTTGVQNFVTGHEMRYDTTTYPQTAPPNGWGYCGTNMGPSSWDQNSDSTGYACIDQLGRGAGDLLSNSDFPLSASWPHQALEPIYEWSDTWNQVPGYGGSLWVQYDSSQVLQNRDYYLYTASFNGTTGVGSGLLSSRPSTCTPRVAYWATDTNTLYQCSAPNTWTVYYKPYTYPHPLTGSSVGGTAPSAPAGLKAVVN